jgi:hypothetical protein
VDQFHVPGRAGDASRANLQASVKANPNQVFLNAVKEHWFSFYHLILGQVFSGGFGWLCVAMCRGWSSMFLQYFTCVILGLWYGEVAARQNSSEGSSSFLGGLIFFPSSEEKSDAACGAFVIVLLLAVVFHFFYNMRILFTTRATAVSEKEWLTYDITREEDKQFSSANVMVSSLDASTEFLEFRNDQSYNDGKANLVFCWLSARTVALQCGLGFFGDCFYNLSQNSKWMIERLTDFQFKRHGASYWDVTCEATLFQAFLTLYFTCLTICYFGGRSYQDNMCGSVTQVPKLRLFNHSVSESPSLPELAVFTVFLAWALNQVPIYVMWWHGHADNDYRLRRSFEVAFICFVLNSLTCIAIVFVILQKWGTAEIWDSLPDIIMCKERSFVMELLPAYCNAVGETRN